MTNKKFHEFWFFVLFSASPDMIRHALDIRIGTILIPNFEWMNCSLHYFTNFQSRIPIFFSITWHDPACPGFRSSRQCEPWWNSTLCKKCHFATDAKAYTQSNSYHQNDEKIVKKHQCARWPFRSNSFYAGSHVLQCAQVQVQVKPVQNSKLPF